MKSITELEQLWKKSLKLGGFPAHRFYLNERPKLDLLLMEIHFLLKEELKLLEIASIQLQGPVQDDILAAYRHANAHKEQISALEASALFRANLKPRAETLSFYSFSYYSLEQRDPVNYFGPYLHLHFFLFELARSEPISEQIWFSSKLKEFEAWAVMMDASISRWSADQREQVDESLLTSQRIFEYLLLSFATRQRGDVKIRKLESQFEPRIFYERRLGPLLA